MGVLFPLIISASSSPDGSWRTAALSNTTTSSRIACSTWCCACLLGVGKNGRKSLIRSSSSSKGFCHKRPAAEVAVEAVTMEAEAVEAVEAVAVLAAMSVAVGVAAMSVAVIVAVAAADTVLSDVGRKEAPVTVASAVVVVVAVAVAVAAGSVAAMAVAVPTKKPALQMTG